MHRIRPCTGLSLLELLAVLAIVSILLSAGMPNWQDMMRSQALKAAVSEWMVSLHRARAEALRRGLAVDVLPLQAGNWNPGWVLARDANGNRILDATEQRFQSYGPMSDAIRASISFGGKPLQFQASGRPLQTGHVLLVSGAVQRKIVLNMLGRVRVCEPGADGRC
ncbi:GspH/FimT family pseudopilin [Lacisediminimonas profundi]|uniref:GspH/FimT family pseudopilin n=1 Tax=Lacisediminimonas profundi TaxID=2603856 RepID=UPI001F4FCD1E|nr:GspH/FimT family pseudopilin [Lacisediminimonas profundi]